MWKKPINPAVVDRLARVMEIEELEVEESKRHSYFSEWFDKRCT